MCDFERLMLFTCMQTCVVTHWAFKLITRLFMCIVNSAGKIGWILRAVLRDKLETFRDYRMSILETDLV